VPVIVTAVPPAWLPLGRDAARRRGRISHLDHGEVSGHEASARPASGISQTKKNVPEVVG